MFRQLVALALPALIFIALSQLSSQKKLPKFIQAFFDFFGYIGNITLCIYCTLVGLFSLFGLRIPDRTPLLIVLHIAVALFMFALAYSFYRSARKASKPS